MKDKVVDKKCIVVMPNLFSIFEALRGKIQAMILERI